MTQPIPINPQELGARKTCVVGLFAFEVDWGFRVWGLGFRVKFIGFHESFFRQGSLGSWGVW